MDNLADSRALRAALPRGTRLRLRLTRAVDDMAYRLICRGHSRAAIRLWKVTGLWHD